MKRLSKGSWACALGIGLIASSPFAIAQQTSGQAATPTQTEQLERIEVTGSYIRRVDTETPSPVQVLNADEIRRTGATNIADVLSNLTGNNQGTLSQGFSGAFAEGACGIALRGMTVGSTLVLLDGHRMAPYPLADDGQRSFVDICSLPLDVVERVEVLKDGASATYGSDAIAGVVNVILKKSFQGATISAENGWSQRGGGQTGHMTGTFGMGDLGADGYNGYLSLEYRHQDPIMLSQRPYLNNFNYTAQGGQNLTPGANNTASPVGTPTPVSSTGYFVNPALSTTFANYGYLPGCNATAAASNQCEVNTNWLYVEPPTQNLNILGRITTKLGSDWSGNLTASMFQSEVMIDGPPAFIMGSNGGYSAAGFSPGPNHTTTAIINTVPTFQAPILASYGLNPANFPVGSLQPVNFMTNDLGGQDTFIKNNTYRLTGEVKGSAFGWDIDGDWGWTSAVMEIDQTGFPIFAVLQADLANGSYQPGVTNNASLDQTIAPALYSKNTDSLWFTGAHASRDLLDLPGGKLGFATGVDFFFRSLQAVPAHNSITAQQATNFAYAEGSQSDWSVYGELAAPVFKSLEVDGAVRYDHYDTYGGSTTPKIGFKWTPVQAVALRGTYSQGFRAPNPVESASSGAGGYFFNSNDPILCPTGNKTAPNTYPNQCSIPYIFLTVANPELKPETSIAKTMGIILEPAKWISGTIDWYDITLNNQIYPSSEDSAFTPIPVRGAPQTQPYINSAGVATTATPAVGNLLYLTTPYININSTETKGLEYDLKNRFDLGPYGKLKSDFMVTHMLHYYFSQPGLVPAVLDLAGTHGPNEISGDTGTPRNRARWNLTWEKGPFEVQGAMNYISGYAVTDPSAITPSYPNGQVTCQEALNAASETPNTFYNTGAFFPPGTTPPAGACHVASFTDFDLYTSWQIDHHWMVHASIDNVLDREPPTDLQTYAAPGYNPSLHMAGAIGRFFNLGVRYVF
jgi:iron complex outermembrane receptor protein